MPRRKRKKLNRLKRKRSVNKGPKVEIHPETKRWIFIIALFAIAGISLLGLFDLAGSVGEFIDRILALFFGWLKYLFPIILVLWGYFLLNKKTVIKPANYIGFVFFILSLTALMHLIIPFEEAILAVDQGRGGGYIGLFLSYAFQNIMGFLASLISLIAIFIISLLLVINASVEDLKESKTILGRFLGRFMQSISIVYYKIKLKIINRPEKEEDDYDDYEEDENEEEDSSQADDEEAGADVDFANKNVKTNEAALNKKEEIKLDEPKVKRVFKKIDLPMDLLDGKVGKPTSGNIAENKMIIQNTLESFNIPVEMADISVGPTVTQYTLKPAEGVKLSRITALNDDLALALAAHPLRIEAPIPGKSLVGIEVPNQSVALVRLRELLESPEFKKRKTNLALPIGRDVAGNTWIGNLAKMPHVLVAGQTGSGKSVCLHTIIVSLLYQNGPDTLKFIMVDPKRVEMPAYNDIPHLLTPVITDLKKTVNALKWTLTEMDRRYQFLEKLEKRNIQDYNAVAQEKIPYIVFVIDEMADLMSSMGNEVETLIIRLAQMARAVGIHLVLATQRPSVEVITGLIKANIPARIAFAVASITDSRTILDYGGAEKLIGRGDMLYTCAELSKPKRLQGAFVSDNEVKKVVNFLKQSGEKPEYETGVVEKQTKVNGDGTVDFSDPDEGDELFDEAKELILQAGRASTSYLQRKLKVGYARAARIMDLLEEAGVIGPANGAKPREILITEKEVNETEDYEGPEMQKVPAADLDFEESEENGEVEAAAIDEEEAEETENESEEEDEDIDEEDEDENEEGDEKLGNW
jgi:DNA segregation ATPase FtsK/SpoIIIE, S-DNA-T family